MELEFQLKIRPKFIAKDSKINKLLLGQQIHLNNYNKYLGLVKIIKAQWIKYIKIIKNINLIM
jgi:hypothetical protein